MCYGQESLRTSQLWWERRINSSSLWKPISTGNCSWELWWSLMHEMCSADKIFYKQFSGLGGMGVWQSHFSTVVKVRRGQPLCSAFTDQATVCDSCVLPLRLSHRAKHPIFQSINTRRILKNPQGLPGLTAVLKSTSKKLKHSSNHMDKKYCIKSVAQ